MINLFEVSALFENIFFILIAVCVLLFMITIHELGHYTAGKLLGFKINEFAIGMGPKLFSRKLKSGEVFSIRALPLGGFCAFEGEDEDAKSSMAFNNQKPWKRLVTLFSGAFFNFVSAILIVIIAFSCFGDYLPTVKEINVDGPNYVQGEGSVFQTGDVLLEIDGKVIYLSNDVSRYIGKGEVPRNVELVVLRNGERKTITAKIDKYGEDNKYLGFGVSIGAEDRIKFGLGESILRSFPYCIRVGGYILETLGGLITGIIGLDQMGGMITTIDITSQIARGGLGNILFLITLISVNLAVFNLLPLPALDGSRMVFVAIEWVRGKPINRNIEAMVHFVGIILLFGFAILLDLMRYLG